MNISLEKLFHALHSRRIPAESAYLLSRDAGVEFFDAMKALRETYGLDVAGAKEVIVRATSNAKSLDEYQGRLLEGLRRALAQEPLELAPTDAPH